MHVIAFHMRARKTDGRPAVTLFRLDYLSCLLTVVATILVGRRMWSGLVVSCVNSLIVCVIGLHTSQYGFVPANVFCICINAFNLRAWLKDQNDSSKSGMDAARELLARIRSAMAAGEGMGVAIGSIKIKGLIPWTGSEMRPCRAVRVRGGSRRWRGGRCRRIW